jgi:hypothetical protein
MMLQWIKADERGEREWYDEGFTGVDRRRHRSDH